MSLHLLTVTVKFFSVFYKKVIKTKFFPWQLYIQFHIIEKVRNTSIVCLPVISDLSEPDQGLYWFRRGLWSWGSHPQTPGLRTNRETKYKRRRTVRVSSLSAAHQPWCTHTSGIWCRLCEKPCRVSFAPVDVSWSYWSSKPVGGRTAKGMLNQRLWWEIPQGTGFRTGVRFPSGPFMEHLKRAHR